MTQPDFCGPASSCAKQCSERYPSGECKTYKADFCKATSPAPTCTKFCAERYPSGECKSYGSDLCQ